MKNTNLNDFFDGKEQFLVVGSREFVSIGREEFEGITVVPVFTRYRYKNNSIGGERNLEFDGYIIDGVYYTVSDYYFRDSNVDKDIVRERVCTLDKLSRKLSEKLTEILVSLFEKEYDSIQPKELTENEKNEIKKDFIEGCNMEYGDILKEVLFAFVKDGSKSYFRESYENLLFLNKIEKEVKAVADGRWEWYKEKIAFEKGKNAFLLELNGSELNNSKTVIINRLFNQLEKDGAKKVSVTFDFGYAKVTEKVLVKRGYWFIDGCREKTYSFQKKYRQYITMKDDEFEDFIPYIEKISYGKKTLYEGIVICKYQNENQLISKIQLLETRDCNDNIITFIEDNTFDKEVLLQRNLIDEVMRKFYSTLNVVKALLSIGCECTEKTFEPDGFRYHHSRNRAEILEYLKSHYEEK